MMEPSLVWQAWEDETKRKLTARRRGFKSANYYRIYRSDDAYLSPGCMECWDMCNEVPTDVLRDVFPHQLLLADFPPTRI